VVFDGELPPPPHPTNNPTSAIASETWTIFIVNSFLVTSVTVFCFPWAEAPNATVVCNLPTMRAQPRCGRSAAFKTLCRIHLNSFGAIPGSVKRRSHTSGCHSFELLNRTAWQRDERNRKRGAQPLVAPPATSTRPPRRVVAECTPSARECRPSGYVSGSWIEDMDEATASNHPSQRRRAVGAAVR
jgi:hypothetical protein